MATPPAEQAVATRNDFDVIGDDGRNDDAAPDGGYGWICVAACFTLNAFTWGTVSVSRLLLAGMPMEVNRWLLLHPTTNAPSRPIVHVLNTS